MTEAKNCQDLLIEGCPLHCPVIRKIGMDRFWKGYVKIFFWWLKNGYVKNSNISRLETKIENCKSFCLSDVRNGTGKLKLSNKLKTVSTNEALRSSNTVWKNKKFTLTFYNFVKTTCRKFCCTQLISFSRNILKKKLRVNFHNFHTISNWHFQTKLSNNVNERGKNKNCILHWWCWQN